MSSARRAALAAGALVVLALLVAAGRWERSRYVRSQLHGFHLVQRAIGPLDSPALAGFRVLPGFDCLTYRRNGNPLALELCVDPAGRVLEAADRRAAHRRFWTLRFEPAASTDRVDRDEVERLVHRMEAS